MIWKTLHTFQNDEIDGIKALISSAVLDVDVKGGLRWPLGKNSSGDRYTIVGVWHTNAKTYRNSSIRLKVRHADRFDFRTSSGEVAREVSLKLHGIVSQIQVSFSSMTATLHSLGGSLIMSVCILVHKTYSSNHIVVFLAV